ncbi:hypothetical protein L249_7139 [Ophiocordyceps polyrhachis-furcata BCC 54312]|uniref:Uncharacterized protein n=1 Tax=Ophiocordyceps polyrhachis-furcata BCC 54312 TaxID=1330021 RepID=A0A367L9J2_9HYPO|nr:hypothetical protein L249_7139 [Ophiocordyceps polyrhachis-furcata BCC 54312]
MQLIQIEQSARVDYGAALEFASIRCGFGRADVSSCFVFIFILIFPSCRSSFFLYAAPILFLHLFLSQHNDLHTYVSVHMTRSGAATRSVHMDDVHMLGEAGGRLSRPVSGRKGPKCLCYCAGSSNSIETL